MIYDMLHDRVIYDTRQVANIATLLNPHPLPQRTPISRYKLVNIYVVFTHMTFLYKITNIVIKYNRNIISQ